MLLKILVSVIFILGLRGSYANVKSENLISCDSTKEYITTLNFLRKNDTYQIKEKDARLVAQEISRGCTGAAQRFINIVLLLTQASIDTASAINIAKNVSLKGEVVNKAFINVFRRAYRSEDFDLSGKDALKLANYLALDYEGNIDISMQNFNIFSRFCLSRGGLDLSKRNCAEMIKRLVKIGDKFKQPIGIAYMELYDFLISDNGPHLPLYEALDYAEKSIHYGPKAVINFKKAYLFAIHKNGLNATRKGAIKFALLMAQNSLKTETDQ